MFSLFLCLTSCLNSENVNGISSSNISEPSAIASSNSLDGANEKYFTIMYNVDDEKGYLIGDSIQTLKKDSETSEVTVRAHDGFVFLGWDDDNKNETRKDVATSNAKYTAVFSEKDKHTCTYIALNGGYIVGDSEQISELGVELSEVRAVPNKNYKFVEWSDGLTTETRKDRLTHGNETYYAKFAQIALPVFEIYTDGKVIVDQKENWIPCKISAFNSEEKFEFQDCSASIKGRGNHTWAFPKKPYKIKFDKKRNLFGLNKNREYKKWVLLADYLDYSLLRNYSTFNFAKELNIYSSDCCHVELIMNGEYCGVYLLCEQNEIKEGRIEINYSESGEQVLTTDYWLEQDFYWRIADPHIQFDLNGMTYAFEIKNDELTNEQHLEIQEYFEYVLNLLFNNSSEDVIRKYFDIDSAIEMTVLFMLCSDGDPNGSFNIFVNKNGIVSFEAPWDFDWAYGNMDRKEDWNEYLSNIKDVKNPKGMSMNYILLCLMNFDWYFDILKARYETLKPLFYQTLNEIKEYGAYLASTFKRNFKKWDLLGKRISLQPDCVAEHKTWEDAYNYFCNWTLEHINYIDVYLNSQEEQRISI